MLAAIVVGVWAMIFMTALMRGMVDQMVKDAVANLTGHIQIHDSRFRDDPSIQNVMHIDLDSLMEKLDGADIVAWAARLDLPAVISSERETAGVTLVGIDPMREKGLSFAGDPPAQGALLKSADDHNIIIGKKLAEKLETKLGNRVVIMTQDPDNNIADRGMRIAGIFDAELEATELRYAFTGLHTLQQLTKVKPKAISEIALLSHDYRHLEPLVQKIQHRFPDKEVLSWTQLNGYLKSMLELTDAFILVWYLVVFLAMSFGLVNTLLMAIFERTRDIGLMQALGLKPKLIILQVVIETIILLLIGLVVGNLLSWLTYFWTAEGIDLSGVAEGMEYWGMTTVLYPSMLPLDILLSNMVVLVLGVLASLYPAWHAARFVPVKAIGQK